MATNTLSSTIVLELLRDDNYANWSSSMKNYLLAHDLWDIVEATQEPTKPVDDEAGIKKLIKKNAAAVHAIQISCGVDILSEIREISSAKIVWIHLGKRYGPSNSSNITVRDLDCSCCGCWKDKALSYKEKNSPNFEEAKSVEQQMTDYRCCGYCDYCGDVCHEEQILGKASEAECVEQPGSVNYDLLTAIIKGDWDAAKYFLSSHQDATRARISVNGRTVLHVAVFAGHTEIVENLVDYMSAVQLEIPDDKGLTALAWAVILKNTRMVKCMLRKNTDLLNIHDKENRIPLIAALESGNIVMANYLYYAYLPCQILSDIDGSTVLTQFILLNQFDLALDLLRRYPRAAIVPNKYPISPLGALACKRSAFPSGNHLGFWKKRFYACIPIRSAHCTNDIWIEIHNPNEHQNNQAGIIESVIGLLRWLSSNLLKLLGIKQIYEMKLLHHQARGLLHQMCKQVINMKGDVVIGSMFEATKGGILEFIDELVQADHSLLHHLDRMGRNIFFYVVLHRQSRIFSLICKFKAKNSLTNVVDKYGSTILHMAAMLEPSTTRDRIPGEALKMQSEFRWFKKVERICHPWIKDIRNDTKMTARELFTHNHMNMKKEGEKWMKDAASACTVIGTLIIGIMFTAAFTVPGGNDQNTGFPMFSHKKLFTVFIISDALSLLSSSTSVLIFLGMVTSRYTEEDFSQSLPLKMIIGHYTLFFSIATMMIAFFAGLFIMLPGKSWLLIPVICLAIVTVVQFAYTLFPHLVYMLKEILIYRLGMRYL